MMQRKARGTWRALLLARPNAQPAPNSTSPSVLAVRAAEPIEIWLWLILLLYAGTPRPISIVVAGGRPAVVKSAGEALTGLRQSYFQNKSF
jgi:hypothetical protein